MSEKSLYERMGGYVPIARLASEIIDRCFSNATGNKNLNVLKFHVDETYRAANKVMLTTWLIEESGGPKCYIGRSMKEAHKNLAITEEQFDAVGAEAVNVLDRYNVPEKEKQEILEILTSFRNDVVTA